MTVETKSNGGLANFNYVSDVMSGTAGTGDFTHSHTIPEMLVTGTSANSGSLGTNEVYHFTSTFIIKHD